MKPLVIELLILPSVLSAALLPFHAGAEPVSPLGVQFGKEMSNAQLEQQRGGQEPAPQFLNDMAVTGNVTDNTASNNVTGNNTITNSFTNATGFPIAVQNSGNNVLIQNATIINLQVH